MNNGKDICDIMEDRLKDDTTRTIKEIKNMGNKIITKIREIDEEIDKIDPKRNTIDSLNEDDKKKIIGLYSLKKNYRIQFDTIMYVLNKQDELINRIDKKMLMKYYNLEDKFFI